MKYNEIDHVMWDRCIARSHNGNAFGYSWFLDSVCNEWDALVMGNYNAVFPLPVKRNPLFHNISIPPFLIKTNIYQSKEFNNEITAEFLKRIPFFYRNISLRTSNASFVSSDFKISEINSFKLDLISSYNKIKDAYSSELRDQLKLCNESKTSFNTGILPNGLVLLASVTKDLNKKQADNLRRLSAVSLRRKLGEIYGAFNTKNRLFASALFISSHYKTYIVYSVQTKEAKRKNALIGLIDHYIKTHSEKALTLDFSGIHLKDSNFIKGFGASEYPLYSLKKKTFI